MKVEDLKLVDSIDWELLSRIYKFNNWCWIINSWYLVFPTADDLRECVEDLIGSIRNLDNPQSQCSTGRLTVFRLDDIVKVWVGCTQNKKNLEPGFWAHKAVEKLTELQGV